MQSGRIILALVAAFAVMSAPAAADTVDDVFLVVENPVFEGPFLAASFVSDGYEGGFFETPTHTIINFATFLGGTYPFPLAQDTHGTDSATLFGATGFFPEDFNGQPFFIIGTATGDDEVTHMILSNPFGAPAPDFFPDDLEGHVIDGLSNLDELVAGALGTDGGVSSLFGEGESETDGLEEFINSLVGGFEGETADPFGVLAGFIDQGSTMFNTSGDGGANIFGFTDPVLLGTQTVNQVGTQQQNAGTQGAWDPLQTSGDPGADPIPEPGTLGLCGLVVAGLVWRRRRRS